jgi:hypothetical protein
LEAIESDSGAGHHSSADQENDRKPRRLKDECCGVLNVRDYLYVVSPLRSSACGFPILSGKPADFVYIFTTFVACGPLGPSTTSKLTSCPCFKLLNPSS